MDGAGGSGPPPPGTPRSELIDRLRALDEAARVDPDRALRLKAELVESRLLDRLEGLPAEGAPLDVPLLVSLGRDLDRLGFHEAAMLALAGARGHAEASGETDWARRAAILGAHTCISLLDFEEAERLLGGIPWPEPAAPAGEDGASSAPVGEDPSPPASPSVGVEAQYAAGRLAAARGDLSRAHQLLTRALGLAVREPSPWVSTPDLALVLAETALDLGAFDEAEELADRWAGALAPERTRSAWSVLEGTLHHARGRLSDADRSLARVLDAGPGVDQENTRAAAWQRAQILVLLNRLDEARKVATAGGQGSPGDAGYLEELIAARRGSYANLHTPPSPREILAFSAEAVAPLGSRREPGAPPPSRHRTRERVRDEWARRANAVLRDFQRGDDTAALERFALLSAWTPAITSPLIQARYSYLTALVAYFVGDWATSESAAREALERFRVLDMVADQWNATRVLYWALKSTGGRRDELAEVSARSQRLLAELQGRLAPQDRVSHSLNKWSAVDEAVSAWCGRLRDGGVDGADRSGRARSVLDRIAVVKSWDALLDHSGDPGPSEARPAPGTDPFGWARERLHGRRTVRGLPGYALPFLRFWLPRDAAVVHYVVLPERIEVFLVDRSGVRLLDAGVDTSRASLMELVRSALHVLAGVWEWDEAPLETLSGVLRVGEIAEAVGPGVSRLVIVPDDTVVHVPFAALPLDGAPLVERFETVLVPHQRWSRRDRESPTRFRDGVAVAVSGSVAAPAYQTLSDPVEEITGVARVARRSHTVLRDEDALRTRVLRALSEARIAHFACHGEFRFDDPLATGLLVHDGWLEVRDLQGLDLRSLDLAVLAACFGADMKVLPGRELVSLPVAFIEAGAGSVVAPLWELFEESAAHGAQGNPTADFFREFYSRLPVEGASRALAEVQRAWWNRRPTSDWAGYQVYAAGVAPRRPLRWLLPVLEAWNRRSAVRARK